MSDTYWDSDFDEDDGESSGFNINGIPISRVPVMVEQPKQSGRDMERFIMSLPPDEGKVLAVRLMGFQGEDAAKMAGFDSIWIYIRKLKRLQARALVAKGFAL